jgi:hypothetical protein
MKNTLIQKLVTKQNKKKTSIPMARFEPENVKVYRQTDG